MLFLLLSMVFSTPGSSQCIVKGVVTDAENGQKLPYADLQLFSIPDSIVVKAVNSDTEGHFLFESNQEGSYSLMISYMGYEKAWFEIELTKGLNQKNFSLHPVQYFIDEVEIQAEKNIRQTSLEKTVINVKQNTTLSGTTGREVLQSLPSIDIDIDGKIHYRGSDKLIILINGTRSSLVNSLEQIPAEQIEKVEIINNPSAKYDAEGMSGIINIVFNEAMKKQRKHTFLVKAGYPETFGGSIGYSDSHRKLSYTMNGSINRQTKFQTKDHLRKNYEDPNGIDYHQFDRQDEYRNNALLNTQFNYRINKNQRIHFTLLGSTKFNTADRSIEYSSIDKTGTTLNQSLKNIEIDLDNYLIDARVNYHLDYLQASKLHVQGQWSLFDQLNEMNNEYYSALWVSTTELQNTYSRQHNRESYLAIDNVNTLGSNLKLESGFQYTARDLMNDFSVEDLDRQTDQWIVDPGLSNVFDYSIDIEAAYLNLNYQVKKFSIQMGLRSEWTQTIQEDSDDQNYRALFPSASLLFHVHDHLDIYSGYNRRINRPTIKMLNPYTYEYADVLNRHTGNPSLQPEFVHSFEVGARSVSEKWTGSLSIYYRNIDQAISRVKSAANDSALVVTFMNLEGAKMAGAELFLSIDPFPFWQMNGSINLFRTQMTGTWENNQIDQLRDAWNLNLTNRFKLPYQLQLQLITYYRSKLPDVMGTYQERYYMDLGLSRKIMKNKGKLVFRISDVFNTYRYGLDLDAIDENLFHYSQRNRRKNQSQYFVMSLTYNFSQQKEKKKEDSFFLERFGK